MTLTIPGSKMETKVVDAYLYLHTNGVRERAENEAVFRAFEAAVAGTLSPTGPGRAINNYVLKQTYQVSDKAMTATSLRELRQTGSVTKVEADFHVEVVLLRGSASPRPVRLAVFDMDSTLIDQEVIDELAGSIGKTAEVSALTEAAMRGELDFAASLKARVALLRGVRADVWTTLHHRITVAAGARALCAFLKQRGVTMAVFSGGFQPMAEWLKGELGLDVAVANHLVTAPSSDEFPYEHLTGELVADAAIVTAERKRTLLHELAAERGIALAETLCVGDGANDLPMLHAVGNAGGIAVACRAKPLVQAEAPNRLNTNVKAGINTQGLEDLIWLFDDEALREE